MRRKIIYLVILVLSLASLFISLKTFYNLAIYVDEANTSPSVVLGGDIWLLMTWIKFSFLGIITLLAGKGLLTKEK